MSEEVDPIQQDNIKYADLDAVLMGQPPAAKFADPGALVVGTIISADPRQAVDFQTKEPKFWPDGAKVMEAIVILNTPGGMSTLYVNSRGLRDAIRQACLQAGVGLRPGGRLVVKYVDDEPPARPGMTGAKIYEAAYDPPADVAARVLEQQQTAVIGRPPSPAEARRSVEAAAGRSAADALIAGEDVPF